jgi:hypothetical protein
MVKKGFVNQYSALDRLLHRIAFSSIGAQVSLADIEDRIYATQLADVSINSPVFVTALPRAGTTIVLNLLYESGQFTSHTYRNMPFVMCPLIWSRIFDSLGPNDKSAMERAHGDGINISVDSPEAFDEIIWSHYWRQNYADDHIQPWHIEDKPEFLEFYKSHIRKLLLLTGRADRVRYVSKNNLNIARLSYLRETFPDSISVVMFREPLQHAASLLKQHINFLDLHRKDKFAKDYMRGIGHYDFGENLLPVNFAAWLSRSKRSEATTLLFWLEYWTACYQSILKESPPDMVLISFDELVRNPVAVLAKLAEHLKMQQPEKLVELHASLHTPRPHLPEDSDIPRPVIAKALELYERLECQAVIV